jgi:hypothetical protein
MYDKETFYSAEYIYFHFICKFYLCLKKSWLPLLDHPEKKWPHSINCQFLMNEAFWFTTLQFQSQPRETDQCMNIGYVVFSQGPYSTMIPWCYIFNQIVTFKTMFFCCCLRCWKEAYLGVSFEKNILSKTFFVKNI